MSTMIQDIMSGAGSIEDMLDLWVFGLRTAKERISRCLRNSVLWYLNVPIGNESRKIGWMRIEAE
ncbi:hypothetical protein [Acetobacter vaccinii]|uniref:hypothetical protein n=1 Tax=Acetobacter vaccinii TaxID=2592655 RepID=UPI001FEF1883|nr:hypothetical protein [Acetobacter vaccinii]